MAFILTVLIIGSLLTLICASLPRDIQDRIDKWSHARMSRFLDRLGVPR